MKIESDHTLKNNQLQQVKKEKMKFFLSSPAD